MRQIKASAERHLESAASGNQPVILAMGASRGHYEPAGRTNDRTAHRLAYYFCGMNGHSQDRCMFKDSNGNFQLAGVAYHRMWLLQTCITTVTVCSCVVLQSTVFLIP